MLKYTFTLFLLVFPFLLKAQENRSSLYPAKIKKNSILLGGNISGSFSKFNNGLNNGGTYEQGTNIFINSQVKTGYFVNHDFVIGLEVDQNYTNTVTRNETGSKSTNQHHIIFGPFARYYLDNGLFGEVSAGVGTRNLVTNRKNNLYAGSVGVGYAYFLNEKIAIEPMVSFRYYRETNTINHNSRFGPMLGVGVQAYFLRETSRTIRYGL